MGATVKTGDWFSFAFLCLLVGLWFLGRRKGKQNRASAIASAYASGRAELQAELAATATASATGGSVAVHIGGDRDNFPGERLTAEEQRTLVAILGKYRETRHAAAYHDTAVDACTDHVAALESGGMRELDHGRPAIGNDLSYGSRRRTDESDALDLPVHARIAGHSGSGAVDPEAAAMIPRACFVSPVIRCLWPSQCESSTGYCHGQALAYDDTDSGRL